MKKLHLVFCCSNFICATILGSCTEKKTVFSSVDFGDKNYERSSLKFTIFEDQHYMFEEINANDSIIKKEDGQLTYKQDTLFFNTKLLYNEASKALIKNGYLLFLDGIFINRLKINKNGLSSQKTNSITTPSEHFYIYHYLKNQDNYWFSEHSIQYSNQDLSSSDLRKLETILRQVLAKDSRLRKYDDYIKQIVAVKNNKHDILISVNLVCKSEFTEQLAPYIMIKGVDGGNCNAVMLINFSQQKAEKILISGNA